MSRKTKAVAAVRLAAAAPEEQATDMAVKTPEEEQETDTEVKTPEQERLKVTVLRPFADRYDGKTQYSPGDTPVFDAERAGDLIGRGLAELRIEE